MGIKVNARERIFTFLMRSCFKYCRSVKILLIIILGLPGSLYSLSSGKLLYVAKIGVPARAFFNQMLLYLHLQLGIRVIGKMRLIL